MDLNYQLANTKWMRCFGKISESDKVVFFLHVCGTSWAKGFAHRCTRVSWNPMESHSFCPRNSFWVELHVVWPVWASWTESDLLEARPKVAFHWAQLMQGQAAFQNSEWLRVHNMQFVQFASCFFNVSNFQTKISSGKWQLSAPRIAFRLKVEITSEDGRPCEEILTEDGRICSFSRVDEILLWP